MKYTHRAPCRPTIPADSVWWGWGRGTVCLRRGQVTLYRWGSCRERRMIRCILHKGGKHLECRQKTSALIEANKNSMLEGRGSHRRNQVWLRGNTRQGHRPIPAHDRHSLLQHSHMRFGLLRSIMLYSLIVQSVSTSITSWLKGQSHPMHQTKRMGAKVLVFILFARTGL